LLRGQAASEKIPFGIFYGLLRRVRGQLEAERDKNERKDGVREPREGEDVRELEIWRETRI
jgi:hypothetical protein